ncbi:MAG: NHL repeat-containing protein, partial [Myxococcales bacterium]
MLAGQPGGPGNVDGTGAAAHFHGPGGLAFDGAGNLYVVDELNDTIRTVAVATGVVTTLAGSPGVAGSADGTGAAARFDQPSGIAFDGAGNLYVADYANCAIRMVAVATGAVTTLAGSLGICGSADGIGAAARFDGPSGLALDGAGNLYVADSLNNTIRKVVLPFGLVTTLAGSPGVRGSADGTGAAANFDGPSWLALDIPTNGGAPAGNLYVADQNNNTIRQVIVATGAVTTLAGSPGVFGSADGTGAAARFNSPDGLAFDGVGNLYVADSGNETIRKVAVATGTVTTLAGSPGVHGSADGTGAAARFFYPTGLALDIPTNGGAPAGNLYVADSGNDAIRKVVVATGVVTTLAGSPPVFGSADGTGAAASFSLPNGLALDGAGNLYVADWGNDTVRKVAVVTGAVTTLAGSPGVPGHADGTGAAASFGNPSGLAFDGVGNLYVADSGNETIREVAVATGAVTTLAGSPLDLGGSADGTGTAARFNDPTGLAFDGAGNLYVADQYNDTIRKVAVATGVVTTLAGSPGVAGSADGTGAAASFNSPDGLAFDGAGNLYVAD